MTLENKKPVEPEAKNEWLKELSKFIVEADQNKKPLLPWRL